MKRFLTVAVAFVAGYCVAGRGGSGAKPAHDSYPVTMEWLAPATDANPYPVRRKIELVNAMEGNEQTELRKSGTEAPAHSVVLTFQNGRRYMVTGH